MGFKSTKRQAKKAQKEKDKMDKAREEQCLPLAKYIMQLIIEADLLLADKTDEEYQKENMAIVKKILERFMEEDIKISDTSYVLKLINEMTANVGRILTDSINSSIRISEKIFWGVNRDDKTFVMLDTKLKEWADEQDRLKEDKK